MLTNAKPENLVFRAESPYLWGDRGWPLCCTPAPPPSTACTPSRPHRIAALAALDARPSAPPTPRSTPHQPPNSPKSPPPRRAKHPISPASALLFVPFCIFALVFVCFQPFLYQNLCMISPHNCATTDYQPFIVSLV